MYREQESHPWLSEFSQPLTDYSFTPDNPLLDVSDPLAEGLKRRKEGDLPSAVLLFEAEVQARPDSVQVYSPCVCVCVCVCACMRACVRAC